MPARYSIFFEGEALSELEEFQKTVGLKKRFLVIQHALRFLYWAIKQMQNGGKLLTEDPNGNQKQVTLTFWDPNKKVANFSEADTIRLHALGVRS